MGRIWCLFKSYQACTSKGTGRHGTALKHWNSLQKNLCPREPNAVFFPVTHVYDPIKSAGVWHLFVSACACQYGQSPYYDSGFQRVWLKQNLKFRGGILGPMGYFLESLSQAMSVGIILVGRLGNPTAGFLMSNCGLQTQAFRRERADRQVAGIRGFLTVTISIWGIYLAGWD